MGYEISEVICLKCLNRWIATFNEETPLKDLECKCGEIGYVIKTGQTLPDIPDKKMLEDVRYKNLAKLWGEDAAKELYRAFIGDRNR